MRCRETIGMAISRMTRSKGSHSAAGYAPGSQEWPGFSYVIDSMMNKPLMAELVDGADIVYHLAAAVGVRLIVESPVRTIETNVRGTEIVLELAAKKQKTVLITSTSEVYGKGSEIP